MKTYFLTAIILMFSVALFGQIQTNDHLTFKGIPIDGTLSDFVSKMKQNGLSYVSTEDGLTILQGDFASYKNCAIGVSTLKDKDLVHKVIVIFPDKPTWSALSGNYFNLKQMLTEKYGNPTEVKEEFDNSLKPRDDNSKMYEVKFDRCKYHSTWQLERGEIQLLISHNSLTSCFVTLAYFDNANSEKIRSTAKDDL